MLLRLTIRRAVRVRTIAPLALAGVATFLISGTAPADDRFVAGQVGVQRTPVSAAEKLAFSSRARSDTTALGLPAGVRRTTTRVTNRFTQETSVDVTAIDTAGEPVSLARYGQDGRLRTAIRFGWKAPSAAIAPERATDRARGFASVAGMAAGGAAVVKRTADGGFSVAWSRQVDGVPVPGDGVRVALWPDGTLHSITTQERPLGASPAMRLPRADAESRATAQLATWLKAPDRTSARITDVTLAWIAPNDMFVAARPDAPGSVLQLAWVVSVTAEGSLAQKWRALEIYLDAGDGTLLGGDILR